MKSENRLRLARSFLGLTQQELADKIDIKWHKIKDIENEKQRISIEVAEKMLENFSINGWWLLTGKGEMLVNQNNQDYKIPLLKNKISDNLKDGKACKTEFFRDICIDKYLFGTKPNEDILAIQVEGTSMYPTIENNSLVIFQRSNTFAGDDLYIIIRNDELSVKRLYKDIKGNLHIKSDNTLYPELIIDVEVKEYDFILGKVKYIIPMLKL